ncbi:uncharacterized protein LOC118744870 isoform X3 [Rhagoletis pomonella]|uniref:uncharacterized protein LOC118744870 isoform X3 n=1 Tax=Rhagoletis pomonella TaxID=28610 RepID=UPI00177CAF31|nr:uncharacterized protein LOC118744870 isoform X3 [Rhagoletis pomonella]
MEDFIAEVHKREFLWNKKNIPIGEQKRITDKLWREVAAACGISKVAAKTRWRSIRDQFLKELKKVPVYSSGESYYFKKYKKPKYTHFDSLMFLMDIYTPSNIVYESGNSGSDINNEAEDVAPPLAEPQPQNLSPPRSTDSIFTTIRKVYTLDLDPNLCEVTFKEESDAFVFDDSKNQTDDGVPPLVLIRHQPADPTHTGGDRAYPLERGNKAHATYLKNNHYNCPDKRVSLELDNQTELENCTDENLNFFRSLLPYMNKMDPKQQLRVRMRFQELMIEEMGRTKL